MATIKLTNDQLKLIQIALDFYSRIGILQFEEILDHPTISQCLEKQFSPGLRFNREFKVGDHTMRGEIVEIGEDYIKTKGYWNSKEEIRTWTDIKNIRFSPDWDKLHNETNEIKILFNLLKSKITGENFGNGNLGIHNSNTDDSARKAFDILQVIRHEFWKANENRSSITVDSSISLTSSEEPVEVKLDTIKDVRNRKIKKISK